MHCSHLARCLRAKLGSRSLSDLVPPSCIIFCPSEIDFGNSSREIKSSCYPRRQLTLQLLHGVASRAAQRKHQHDQLPSVRRWMQAEHVLAIIASAPRATRFRKLKAQLLQLTLRINNKAWVMLEFSSPRATASPSATQAFNFASFSRLA